jgi:hypothetical protein
MDTEKVIALIEGYGAGTLTPEEETAFLQWYTAAGLEEFHAVLAQCKNLPSQLAWYPDMPAELQARLEKDVREITTAERDSGDPKVAEPEIARAKSSAPPRRIPLLRP